MPDRVLTLPPEAPRTRNRFGRWLGRTVLALGGWRMTGGFPDAKKMVIIAAPHSSGWDAVWGLAAKLAMAYVFALAVMAMLVTLGLTVGHVTLPFLVLVRMGLVMSLGVLPACAVGLFIGAHAPASSAAAFANITYLGMAFLSGLFFPLSGWLHDIRAVWPTYHLSQLARAAGGLGYEGSAWVHVAALAATGDIRMMRGGGLQGSRRLKRHLWRMSFAMWVAAASFFWGPRGRVPEIIRVPALLPIPVLAPIAVMFYWLWRLRTKRTSRTIVSVSAPQTT